MTGDDELGRALARTDALSPPPPGAAFGPATLQRALARRRLRHVAVAAATAGLLLAVGARPVRPAAHDAADTTAERRQLQREIVHLLQRAAPPLPIDDGAASDAALAALRLELARGRADALPTTTTATRPR